MPIDDIQDRIESAIASNNRRCPDASRTKQPCIYAPIDQIAEPRPHTNQQWLLLMLDALVAPFDASEHLHPYAEGIARCDLEEGGIPTSMQELNSYALSDYTENDVRTLTQNADLWQREHRDRERTFKYNQERYTTRAMYRENQRAVHARIRDARQEHMWRKHRLAFVLTPTRKSEKQLESKRGPAYLRMLMGRAWGNLDYQAINEYSEIGEIITAENKVLAQVQEKVQNLHPLDATPRRKALGKPNRPMGRFTTSLPKYEKDQLIDRVWRTTQEPLNRFLAYLWAWAHTPEHTVTVHVACKLNAFIAGTHHLDVLKSYRASPTHRRLAFLSPRGPELPPCPERSVWAEHTRKRLRKPVSKQAHKRPQKEG